jgi:hypothetical protein
MQKKVFGSLAILSSVAHADLFNIEDNLVQNKPNRESVVTFLEDLKENDIIASSLIYKHVDGTIKDDEMAGWEAYAKWPKKI